MKFQSHSSLWRIQPSPDSNKKVLNMNRPWSVGMLLLSFLLCANPALAKNPYEKSFDLNPLGKSIGQVIVSFEDRIKPGSFTFGVSTSLSSLLSSGFPP